MSLPVTVEPMLMCYTLFSGYGDRYFTQEWVETIYVCTFHKKDNASLLHRPYIAYFQII